MKPIHTLFLIFTIFFSACVAEAPNEGSDSKKDSNLETVSEKDAFGNIIEYSKTIDFGLKQGKYTLKTENGNLLEEANYLNDTLHGQRIIYYTNGDTQIVETYSHGLFEGPYLNYYEGGQIELEGNYSYNTMNGVWKRYYESGQLMEEVKFSENEENGPFKEYHENGHIKAEGYYREGDNEHGLLKLYDENGELERTMDCRKGICKTVWKKG